MKSGQRPELNRKNRTCVRLYHTYSRTVTCSPKYQDPRTSQQYSFVPEIFVPRRSGISLVPSLPQAHTWCAPLLSRPLLSFAAQLSFFFTVLNDGTGYYNSDSPETDANCFYKLARFLRAMVTEKIKGLHFPPPTPIYAWHFYRA